MFLFLENQLQIYWRFFFTRMHMGISVLNQINFRGPFLIYRQDLTKAWHDCHACLCDMIIGLFFFLFFFFFFFFFFCCCFFCVFFLHTCIQIYRYTYSKKKRPDVLVNFIWLKVSVYIDQYWTVKERTEPLSLLQCVRATQRVVSSLVVSAMIHNKGTEILNKIKYTKNCRALLFKKGYHVRDPPWVNLFTDN